MEGGTYHILIGNIFLESLEDFKITKLGFEFIIDNEKYSVQKLGINV